VLARVLIAYAFISSAGYGIRVSFAKLAAFLQGQSRHLVVDFGHEHVGLTSDDRAFAASLPVWFLPASESLIVEI
jgi:hypothetical protein